MTHTLRIQPAPVRSGATLIAGSRIAFHGDPADLRDRIRLSTGTQPPPDGAGYVEDALVPKEPWRQPSSDELALLSLGEAAWRLSNDVAIVRIPDSLVAPFVEMLEQRGLREAADPKTYETIATHPDWTVNLERLAAYLRRAGGEQLASIFFRIAEPDRRTLTKDDFGRDGRKLVGLHLDSWDALPMRHRGRSRNRLCINFGREPRYSLFCNLSLMEMFHAIGLRDPEDIYKDFRGLYMGHRFMMAMPSYPIVRLRIDPGEAYILPTDNLLHDASTVGNRYSDITLTYLGMFTP
jgi:hypothetical protein